MKFGQLFIGLLLGGLAGFGVSTFFENDVQQYDNNKSSVDSTSPAKWNWPDSLDAIKAAPANHRVVYEDSAVRVLQVILDGYKEEPVHTHKWKSIMWIAKPIEPCIIYQYGLDKSGRFVVTDSITIPKMETNAGQMIDPEGPTGIKNLGRESGVAYRVEFKKDFKP